MLFGRLKLRFLSDIQKYRIDLVVTLFFKNLVQPK